MSQRQIRNVVHEPSAVDTRRPGLGVAEHGAGPPRTVALFHSAHNLQIANSTLSVVGGDVVHNHNVHYHYERARDIWAILQSIPNFRAIYQDMMSKATPGTGMWLVRGDKFSLWLDPNGDIKIFWGSGIPGAGKTLLASIVIEHLEALYPGPDTKICICYIYFRYSDHSKLTVRTILETLVMQTLERHPGCETLIEQTYARHLRERTEPTEAQLLALLRQLADSMSCTFYILDALDEAPTKIQLAILKALASLNVKLFLTSRPLKPLEAQFPHAHTFSIIAQDADLDLHITRGIGESVELQRLLQASPPLRDEIFSTIKENCGGMFLHASLQLDALHECINACQVRQRLEDFPSRIEDVYLQTWDRILEQNADLVLVAKTVFAWVLNASRSMTVEELEWAVATSPDTYKFELERLVPGTTLFSVCRGLITVEEESRIVRLVHYTAKGTLENLLHEQIPHPHCLLAAVCMTHLTECGFQDTKISSEDEFEAVLKKDPLLPYALEAWAFHAGKSLGVNDSKRRTAQFVSNSKAFPAYTSLDGTRDFDILNPLHILGLYCLPLALMGDTINGNPNVTTAVQQQTPLMVASQAGHEDLVAHLIMLSTVEPNLTDARGRSALILAAMQGHEGINKLLLAYPAIQVNLLDNDCCSALMWAAIQDHKGVLTPLLAHPEIQIDLPDNNGCSALMWAARMGIEGVVKLFLEHPNIQVNLVGKDGWSALTWAASGGHEGVVKLLLAHPHIQINLVDKDGLSALMWAAFEGHKGIVMLLLAHPNIQIDLLDNNGCSALMSAAQVGIEGVVKLFLERPYMQVNLVGKDGWSALTWAAFRGHEGVVKLLLAHPYIQMNLVDKGGRSALMWAVFEGHNGIVMLLLAHPEIKIDLLDNNGCSALMSAAFMGNEGAVKLFLGHPNIQVNLVGKDGWSALTWAASGGHEGVVKLLLAHPYIQMNLVDKDGLSALMWAAFEGHKGIVMLLLAHPNIQIDLLDNNGCSALMSAAFMGNEGAVKLFLGHPDIQVNLVEKDGRSALAFAAFRGHEGVVKLLLAYPCIQMNLVDKDGQSALVLAAIQGHKGVVTLLLTHPDIQVNLLDNNGWSGLMWAARMGNEGVVKLFLGHPGIQANLACNHGSTALFLAAQFGHLEIVDLLLTTGAFDVNASDNDRDTAIKMAAKGGHAAVVRMLLDMPNVDITIRGIADGHTAMSAAQANDHSDIIKLLEDFELRKGVVASPTDGGRLILGDGDSSDSDTEEVYYDTEEGDEGDISLSSLLFN